MSPTRRAYALACGVGVPALLVTVGTVMGLSERDSLPEPLAVHWRADIVTGTSSLSGFLFATLVEVLLPALVILALASRMPRASRPTLVGTAAGLATTLGLASYGLMLGQRGIGEAARAANPSGPVLGSILLGIIAGVAVAQGYPVGHLRERTAPPPPEAAVLPDPAGSPVFAVASRAVAPLLATYTAVLVVSLLVLALVVRDWWVCVAGVALGSGVISMLFPVVRLDDGGLRILGLGFVPWLRYRIGEVEWAEAGEDRTPARGLRHEHGGGWDYRVRPGDVVTVHLHDGTSATFSCPSAATCAAVLNTLVEQRAHDAGPVANGRLSGPA